MRETSTKTRPIKRGHLQKCLTGIKGFDEITEGGLPKDRITLICGSTGSGKTLLGIDFLFNGATNYNEPGVFMSFEETEDELYKNVALFIESLVPRAHLFVGGMKQNAKPVARNAPEFLQASSPL